MREKYWIALSQISGIGSKTIRKVYEEFDDLQQIWEISEQDIRNKSLLTQKQCDKFIKEKKNELEKAEELIAKAESKDIGILTFESENYPNRLFELEDSPPILYYKGKIRNWDQFSISMVGTREPTDEGKKRAYDIAKDMAKEDGVVISGLAYGIDTKSHEGCLDGDGRTIAVLGNGLLDIYPEENKGLARRIIDQNGLILSEVPISYTQPKAWSLRDRNRIISALSDFTIVVEATQKSGSLITARYSRKFGKPVIVPGPIIENISEHEGLTKIVEKNGIKISYADDFVGKAIEKGRQGKSKNSSQKSIKKQRKLKDF